jgi:threonylcarbamoyladenosine tRNA methylthiotransferase MtaB
MNRSSTVAFHTLGCKLNFAETSTLARQLKDGGFSKVDFDAGPDLYVINTCSVTENADKECRQLVRRALATNPDAFVAVIGCYAQLKPEEIASIDGVDIVLGANEKFNLLNFLGDLQKKENTTIHSCDIDQVVDFKASYSAGDRTRAFLKVQDGCDYTCTYCTIPKARGASRSDTLENVIRQAEEIAARGIREIVLTGVNIGDFGLDPVTGTRHETFLDLVRALDNVNGIDRFRISSIEPNLLTDEIITFVAGSQRFVPHFHIPLQSGSDRILKLMRRRYLRQLYVDRVNKIKHVMPDACIGVDVIVGFPSESEEDFQETYNFLNELDISYLHVFTYSERDDTVATEISPVVPMQLRKQRNKMLRILSAKKQRAFYEQHINTTRIVLFESEIKDGKLYGHTDNYLRVGIPVDEARVNTLAPVALVSLNEDGVFDGQLEPFAIQV